jgi:hypothetical protein
MSIFIHPSDFTSGKYKLHVGTYTINDLQEYLDKYETRYLVELLGADLYNQFIADVTLGGGVPTEARFIKIFNPFTEDYSWTILISVGILEMLKGFMYYEYIKDQIVQMTPIGVVTPSGENSRNSNTLYTQIYTRYNDAARTYKTIQEYIRNNSGDYDEFNGVRKMLITYL